MLEGLPPSTQGNHWQHGITIVTPDRKFLFACETEDDQLEWINTFQKVISRPMLPQEYAGGFPGEGWVSALALLVDGMAGGGLRMQDIAAPVSCKAALQRLFEQRGVHPGRRRRMVSFPLHCLWCDVHATGRISQGGLVPGCHHLPVLVLL